MITNNQLRKVGGFLILLSVFEIYQGRVTGLLTF
jgi:hypothetical protein